MIRLYLSGKLLYPKPPLEEVEVTVSQKTLALKVGGTKKLTATVKPAGKEVTWATTENGIATVTPDGTVEAISAGTADIKAVVEGKESICKVTLTEVDNPEG